MNELRELDKKIAELNGIIECDKWESSGMNRLPFYFTKRCDHKPKKCFPFYLWPPNYSYKIEEAWPLFEELTTEGMDVIHKSFKGEWRIYFNADLNVEENIFSRGETAPEAIARAWIKWKQSK